MHFIIFKKENSLIHYIGFNNLEISDIDLTSITTPCTAVDAIKTTLIFLQIKFNRENKTERRKLREVMEKIESGGASDLIDI